ncbi:MAG: hypothetical protein JRM77_08885 [Nitrososphaerota archaeon]|jgi:hypothetical protein|nr:hypothetical protein [Nitrososphaerota archaeon]
MVTLVPLDVGGVYVVPERETRRVAIWVCPTCDFRHLDRGRVAQHYAAIHTVSSTFDVMGKAQP